jgi:hypothetical protein
MTLLLRIAAVTAMIVATIFLLVNLASVAGLWMANAPAKSMVTGALTVSDELLLKTDQVMERTDNILAEIVQLGQEIGVTIADVQREQGIDNQNLQPVEGATTRFGQSMAQLEGKLNALRGDAQATEQALAQSIPRVPAYINLVWIGVTLVLLWLALAQAALFYLALMYLRTGSLGWSRQSSAAPVILTDSSK